MSETHIPYEECIEGCMFVIMGKLYDEKYNFLNIEVIEKIEDLPDECKTKEVFKDTVDGLLNEGFITTKHNASTQRGINLFNPLITQKGREWYQEQIENKKPKWKKFFKYVGKRVLDKTIDSVT